MLDINKIWGQYPLIHKYKIIKRGKYNHEEKNNIFIIN